MEQLTSGAGIRKDEFLGIVIVSSLASLVATLNLIIASGTYGATGYAHKYPQYVGNFVLDAVEPRGLVSSNDIQTIL